MNATIQDLLEIETSAVEHGPSPAELAALEDMDAAGWLEGDSPPPVRVTFLDLVKAVSEVSSTETEVVATVAYMLSSGSVELIGAFEH